ncbi:MAG: hypothetical protein JXQ23_09510 [Clostridia bacterium]|nr:hypothetical protein [Clostridia bacterium]
MKKLSFAVLLLAVMISGCQQQVSIPSESPENSRSLKKSTVLEQWAFYM